MNEPHLVHIYRSQACRPEGSKSLQRRHVGTGGIRSDGGVFDGYTCTPVNLGTAQREVGIDRGVSSSVYESHLMGLSSQQFLTRFGRYYTVKSR